MGSLLENIEYNEEEIDKKIKEKEKDTILRSIYLSSYNHKKVPCEKILQSFGLDKIQIIEIIEKNTAEQIKSIICDIETLYRDYKKYGVTPEPNIGTYIYEILNSGEEDMFHH